MYDLEKVKKLEVKSTAYLKTMQKMVDRLASKIDELHDDGTHTEAFIKEQVETERQNALPGIEKLHETIKEVAEDLKTQQAFWESTPMVLSQMSFVGGSDTDEGRAQDATIRLSIGHEMEGLSESLINLHFESAVQDQNWPMAYQCYCAAQRKDVVIIESFHEIDIPGQLKALLSIETAQLNVSEGEFLLRDAHGTRLVPESRLSVINIRDEIDLRIKNIKTRIAVAQAASEKSKAA